MKKTNKHYWSLTEAVYHCLIDKERTLKFKKSILKTVKKGDIVVDLGSGSGVLAMFAVKAGAKKVYAVENDWNNIKTLKETFAANKMTNQIEIISQDVLRVRLKEKLDVVICEMIATGLVEELQPRVMNYIRKYLKPDSRIILQKYTTKVDLVNCREVFHGFKFKSFKYELSGIKDTWTEKYSSAQQIGEVDFRKEIKNFEIDSNLVLTVTKNGIINGLRISGETLLSGNYKIFATPAYSYPIVLPIKTQKVMKGDCFSVKISYKIGGGIGSIKYSVNRKFIHAKSKQ